MNDACPSQRYETACARPELFERFHRRMDGRAVVPFPIHARFHSFQITCSPRRARQQSAIYLTSLTNQSSNPPVPALISESRLVAQSVLA